MSSHYGHTLSWTITDSQLSSQNGFVCFGRSLRVASTLEAKKARDDGKAKIDATDLLFPSEESSGGLTVSLVHAR